MILAKIISPIVLLLSGLLINNISPWMLPLFGGGLQLLSNESDIEKNGLLFK